MNLSKLTNRKWNYVAIAFALPFVGLLTLMLIGSYSPFGKYSMLYSDMYHQYYPFFTAFRQALLSGESLLYNWSVGMGIDYLGLYAYYLGSPLNLLSVLVPEPWLLGYFSLLVPIKLSLASMFFAIFLKKVFQKDDPSLCLFGSFYGLCAWALGYQWNVMWLDTFALLPLVVLGMISLLRDKKFVLYTCTLFLSIFANYYVGFFICIFVFLLFFCYEICRWKGFKRFFGDFLRIALFSVLAIGMTVILELPALAALQNTQSSVNTFPEGFKLNIAAENTWKGLLEAMGKVAGNMNGGISPTFKEGLPNLYCGVITNFLAAIFLFCPKIRLRDKFCAVFLLVLINVSFIVRQLDYIWHGFHFTNMIPYRFSFLYSFVMLYMAYAAWTQRNEFRFWQVALGSFSALGLLFCYEDRSDMAFLAYNGVLLLMYLGIAVYSTIYQPAPPDADHEERQFYRIANEVKKRTCSTFLLGIMAVELILNIVNFGVAFPATNASDYPKGTTDSAKVIAYMEKREKDTLFYRAEVTHNQTLNDGALNGYNGITTFTSSANVNVTEFMRTLGYAARNTYNRYCYEESSPVANLFLGIKYMIERDGNVEENPYFDDVYHSGNVYLLENNAYLPLGFLANSELLDVDFSGVGNYFDFQNHLMMQATGINEKVWNVLGASALAIEGNGPSVSTRPAISYCTYTTDASTAGSVTFSYTADKEGFMCVYLDLSKRNNFSVWLNGQQLYSESYSLPQMVSVSNVQPGDVVELRFTCNKNENGSIRATGAILNEAVFRQGYNVLAESVLELTAFRNTKVTGTVNCLRDGVLYTSIPQNGNWQAIVDGEPAEIVLIGNTMIGLELTEGQHTVQFIYRNKAFSIGWKISLVCALTFAGIYWFVYRPNLCAFKDKCQKLICRKKGNP